MNRGGQQYLSGTGSGSTSGAVTPGAAADEVRVDCCLMTKEGRSVITGSSLGPPQVWDMQVSDGSIYGRSRLDEGGAFVFTHLFALRLY
jgi:hypothetical protein